MISRHTVTEIRYLPPTLTTQPAGNTGIGTSNPSAKLHIVGNNASLIGTYDIRYVLRIVEETWEEVYDCYLNGEFKETITREEYYHNFLLVADLENPDDWFKLVIDDSMGKFGIGSSSPYEDNPIPLLEIRA